MKWIQASENVLFKLSLSTPLNYLKVNSTKTTTATTTTEGTEDTDEKVENVDTAADTESVDAGAGETTLVSTDKQEASAETEYIKVTNEP